MIKRVEGSYTYCGGNKRQGSIKVAATFFPGPIFFAYEDR
jgi:hypothetical protein